MEDMTDFRRQLSSCRPSDWEHLPDFPLYMDQVLSYMERQTVRLDEDDALTASMVNNYAIHACQSLLVPVWSHSSLFQRQPGFLESP